MAATANPIADAFFSIFGWRADTESFGSRKERRKQAKSRRQAKRIIRKAQRQARKRAR